MTESKNSDSSELSPRGYSFTFLVNVTALFNTRDEDRSRDILEEIFSGDSERDLEEDPTVLDVLPSLKPDPRVHHAHLIVWGGVHAFTSLHYSYGVADALRHATGELTLGISTVASREEAWSVFRSVIRHDLDPRSHFGGSGVEYRSVHAEGLHSVIFWTEGEPLVLGLMEEPNEDGGVTIYYPPLPEQQSLVPSFISGIAQAVDRVGPKWRAHNPVRIEGNSAYLHLGEEAGEAIITASQLPQLGQFYWFKIDLDEEGLRILLPEEDQRVLMEFKLAMDPTHEEYFQRYHGGVAAALEVEPGVALLYPMPYLVMPISEGDLDETRVSEMAQWDIFSRNKPLFHPE